MASKLTLEALEKAISNDELVLFYQPKVCLLTGTVVGAEALVRWSDETRDIISPSEFLPLAESSGLLHDMTVKLLDQVVDACIHIREQSAGLAISMNVAPDDLASHTISNRIGALLSDRVISRDELQIEITESAAMGNVERVRDDLDTLNALGIKVLMDDFGTGHSSIDRLSQLPFSALKLDQGVVKRMGTSVQNLDVVRASISMARELGMTSVAEGVESAAAYDFLTANGCEEAQGYWIGRPMSLDDFHSFLDQPQTFNGSQIGRVHQTILNLLQFRKSLVDAAFCRRVSKDEALPSVLHPELSADITYSRVGRWYFGMGSVLESLDSYRVLETPLTEIHDLGLQFIERLRDGLPEAEVDALLLQLDSRVDRLIALLHSLERDLLRSGMH